MMPLRRHGQGDRGFALAVTVMLAAFLALTAITVAISARTASLERRNAADLLLARELAVAGLHVAIQDLARPDRNYDLPHDGRPFTIVLPSGTADIAIEDEHGKLDLTLAPPERIRALFQSVGASYGIDGFTAATLAQHAAGLFDTTPVEGEVPANDTGERRRLLSLAQLASLPGMTPEFQAGLQRHVSVLNFTNKINATTASPEVLANVPDLEPQVRAAILAARNEGTKRPTAGKAELWLSDDEGPAFTIMSTGRLANGIEARVTAVISTSGISLASTSVGVRILEFR